MSEDQEDAAKLLDLVRSRLSGSEMASLELIIEGIEEWQDEDDEEYEEYIAAQIEADSARVEADTKEVEADEIRASMDRRKASLERLNEKAIQTLNRLRTEFAELV